MKSKWVRSQINTRSCTKWNKIDLKHKTTLWDAVMRKPL